MGLGFSKNNSYNNFKGVTDEEVRSIMKERRFPYFVFFLLVATATFLVFVGSSFSEGNETKIALITSSFSYDNEEKVLELKVTIKNITSKEIEGPGIVVSIYGIDNKLVAQRTFRAKRVSLLPLEEAEVKAALFVEGPFGDIRFTAIEGLCGT